MRSVITILFLFVAIVASAQRVDVVPQFGKVTEQEVMLEQYVLDTLASAVLLYSEEDVTVEFAPTGDFRRVTYVYHRWKILSDEGKSAVDYELFYDENSEVSDIRAVTWNNGDNGKVEKTKMSRSFIFETKYTDRVKRVTFAPENVKVGSVVEVSYAKSSRTAAIDDIFMQGEYPVNMARVTVSYPEFFTYNRMQRGYARCDASRTNSVKSMIIGGESYSVSMFVDNYIATDLPAIQEEPYSFCPKQYALSLVYDFRQFWIRGHAPVDYSTKWEDVDSQLRSRGIINIFRKRFPDADALSSVLEGCQTSEQKIVAVRNLVCHKVKWDEVYAFFPSESVNPYKRGSGNSADILSLVARGINSIDGFTACPVLIKSRDMGILTEYHVGISEFNRMILRIEDPDGKVWYLDPIHDDAYLNVLPSSYLVTNARVLPLNGDGTWVDLVGQIPYSTVTSTVSMNLAPGGVMEGKAVTRYTNNHSFNVRADYHSYDSVAKWIDAEDNDIPVHIESMEFQNPDTYSPTSVITMDFTMEDVRDGDEYLYIRPFVTEFHSESTFRRESRITPVDFPFLSKIRYVCNIIIPDGYAIESLPESQTFVAPELGNSSIIIQCRQVGIAVNVSYQCSLDTLLVIPEEYNAVRIFWELACKMEQSVIVLKRI